MTWVPRNQYMWDFWFTRACDNMHLFYLFADKKECGFNPFNKDGLAEIGHAVLTEAGWRQNTPAVARRDKGWDNTSIWSGSTFYEDAMFYCFYTSRTNSSPRIWTPLEWQKTQHIGLCTSDDGINWQRHPLSDERPLISNPGTLNGMDGVAWRDPYVIQTNGAYQMFICTRFTPESGFDVSWESGGAVIALSSKSLTSWSASDYHPLVVSTEFYQMEVPQVFWIRHGEKKRLYLLFSAQEANCSSVRRKILPPEECATGTYYLQSEWMDESDTALPILSKQAKLLSPGLYAGKIIFDIGNHPLFFGFEWSDSAGCFAGGLSDPQRVEILKDGQLALTQI